MFSEKKFLATKETSKAKRMAELLRVIRPNFYVSSSYNWAMTYPEPSVNSRPTPNG